MRIVFNMWGTRPCSNRNLNKKVQTKIGGMVLFAIVPMFVKWELRGPVHSDSYSFCLSVQ